MSSDQDLLDALVALKKLNEAEMVNTYLYAMQDKYPETAVKVSINHPKKKMTK